MELSSNDALTVGGRGSTLTLALSFALPPAPLHVTVTPKLPVFDGV